MNLFVYDIGERARKVSRFIGEVRAELQRALMVEKKSRRLTQQQIATSIGVNRSVINRQLMGLENLTLRRVAELAWALEWEIVFYLRKPGTCEVQPCIPVQGFQNPDKTDAPAQSTLPEIDMEQHFSTAA